MTISLLPTAVVGSYSMPAWLERAKNDFLLRRISRHDLDEIHDMAVKAAIKDQEVAGVDIVSDGGSPAPRRPAARPARAAIGRVGDGAGRAGAALGDRTRPPHGRCACE